MALTMPAPCSTTVLMRSRRVRTFCGLSRLSSMIWAEPLTMGRVLLKSCAITAARGPGSPRSQGRHFLAVQQLAVGHFQLARAFRHLPLDYGVTMDQPAVTIDG